MQAALPFTDTDTSRSSFPPFVTKSQDVAISVWDIIKTFLNHENYTNIWTA